MQPHRYTPTASQAASLPNQNRLPPLRKELDRNHHSERRAARHARKGDDVPDVIQAGGEQNEALEAQAEAAVWHAAVPAEVEVALVYLERHAVLRDALDKDVVPEIGRGRRGHGGMG